MIDLLQIGVVDLYTWDPTGRHNVTGRMPRDVSMARRSA